MSTNPDTLQVVDRPQDYLLHRPPFLFVDRGEIGADRTEIHASYTFGAEEPYFSGHFPADPIVPGVILIELIAQTANLLLSYRAGRPLKGYLVGVDEVKFNAPVRPNDTVSARVQLVREIASAGAARSGRIIAFKGSAYLGSRRCMRAAVQVYRPD